MKFKELLDEQLNVQNIQQQITDLDQTIKSVQDMLQRLQSVKNNVKGTIEDYQQELQQKRREQRREKSPIQQRKPGSSIASKRVSLK